MTDNLHSTIPLSAACKCIQQLHMTKAETARLQQAECPNAGHTSYEIPISLPVSHLSHEMLHDAVESKDVATGSDLRAQWVGLQGYGTLHFPTCHHDYLRKTCGRHVICDSCQRMAFQKGMYLQCQRSTPIVLCMQAALSLTYFQCMPLEHASVQEPETSFSMPLHSQCGLCILQLT